MSQIYKSCNCWGCRKVSSNKKKQHKQLAHRKFRHKTKIALNKDKEPPSVVSTGYKA